MQSGIKQGLKSMLYTWFLLSIVFAIYAGLGVIYFADNDPYHFGDIPISMWTLFELATLDVRAATLYIYIYEIVTTCLMYIYNIYKHIHTICCILARVVINVPIIL